ncbi:hypothetical protein [Aureimonas pseudogalii]|uniref:Uncharacterized protein YgiB involved in biofilm formation n=1 Tax=Aureimonas pseudogalii TaxID=1744844 RepID=A0A7W6H3J8_9HYPH|nr:hypothetical protein [Aureimonas pseudogalii]MBB3997247.1 uncharacterized protein YgiB involved in biofilm formation [Aureimonas pseudogalii]
MARCPYTGRVLHDHYRSNRAGFLDLMARARANGSPQLVKVVQRDAAALRRAHTEALQDEAAMRRKSIDEIITESRADIADREYQLAREEAVNLGAKPVTKEDCERIFGRKFAA